MGELNLPVFEEQPHPPRVLSMDDYVEFVASIFEYFGNPKWMEEQDKETRVDVRFLLTD